ncbi:hypothetical protein GCM10010398_13290 [Streptomyces fimbriatus]
MCAARFAVTPFPVQGVPSTAHRLCPVGPEFVRAASVRLVFVREISAAPEPVCRAPAEDVTGWTERSGAAAPARPLDGGAGRGIRLRAAPASAGRSSWRRNPRCAPDAST